MKITFIPKDSNISAPVTKFGGQPFWLEKPQWPLSRELGTQMQFICQIALDEKIFPGGGGKIAYLFMSADEPYVDETWKPDGGENALIIQPGGKSSVSVIEMSTGPTLQALNGTGEADRIHPEEINWAVDLIYAEDPNSPDGDALSELSVVERDTREDAYSEEISGNKIGGTPYRIQGGDFPSKEDPWLLLLQLDSTNTPFYINFGDAGTGYAFIKKDMSEGFFEWECY